MAETAQKNDQRVVTLGFRGTWSIRVRDRISLAAMQNIYSDLGAPLMAIKCAVGVIA